MILTTLIDETRLASDVNALDRTVETVSDLVVLNLNANRIRRFFAQIRDSE